MARKKFTPTSEEIKAMRLEKTKNYLESIGVMMPILKDARAVSTTDIIKNKDFIRKIDVFLLDHLAELTEDKKFAKLISKKGTRKLILNRFLHDRLEVTINKLPDTVWDLLLTTIMVDSIDDTSGEWLDFEYTLDVACIKKYYEEIKWMDKDFGNVGVSDIYCDIADYIDYVTMVVSINIFKFSREVDEQSRYQMMGNIGGLDDIRVSVQNIFLGEVFGDSENKKWINEIIEDIK